MTDLAELDALARAIAERTCSDFPGIDPEDLGYTLRQRILGLLSATVDPQKDISVRWLRAEAREEALKIRQELLKLTDQYHYRPSDVSVIMETVFDRCDWPSGFTPHDAQDMERDDMASLEVRMDACHAFEGLRPLHREALIKRYHDLIDPLPGSDDQKILRDALDALTRGMNERD